MRYRKKPIVIEAKQFTGRNEKEFWLWLGDSYESSDDYNDGETSSTHINIHTLEGVMTASPGDWIIRGIKGEYYPCKPDIFEASYEAVND